MSGSEKFTINLVTVASARHPRLVTCPWMKLLSPREKQLLRRIAAGKTDDQIAVRIGGSAEQVSKQRARLLGRLGVSTQAEIADAAQRLAPLISYKGVT